MTTHPVVSRQDWLAARTALLAKEKAYHHLDLVPRGRDEEGLSYSMEWVRLHDEYGK